MSNDNLKSYVDDFFDELILYDDYYNGHDFKSILKSSIEVFLENKTKYNAFSVFEIFLMIYQITPEDKSSKAQLTQYPNTPMDFARVMQKHDKSITKFKDTFIHSIDVFILGLAIYSQNENYRKAFEGYVLNSPYKKYYNINGEFSNEEFLYRWGIASLFFDIVGPIEIIGDKPFRTSLNDDINSILSRQGESLYFNFIDLKELNKIPKISSSFVQTYTNTYPAAKFLDLFKPTEILAYELAKDFYLDKRKQDSIKNILNKQFLNEDCPCKDPMIIDHGFVSSIVILKIYGYLLQIYAKRSEFFFYPILDSAKAILLHTFYINVLQKRPFNLGVLDAYDNPLAFLLILCDEVYSGIGSATEINISIDSKSFEIDYISRTAEGMNFNYDSETFINSVLSMNRLFKRGFRIYINVDINEEGVLNEIIKSQIQHQQLSISHVENIAMQIHKQFLMQQGIELKSFNELPSDVIIQNIKQARSISRKLNLIGCELANKTDPRDAIIEFCVDEIWDMAILEHEIWYEDKIAQGWKYGEYKDVSKKINPFLVPWNMLDEKSKKIDLDSVKNIPHLVESLGLKIVRSKLALLSFERYKYSEIEVEYRDLNRTARQINLILTNALVKSLNELKFDLVDINDENEAIPLLSNNEIEYLAEREHSNWMNIKLKLGWKYYQKHDDQLRLDPNLVNWHALNYEVKERKFKEFRNLTQACENVGLKIIKR